MAKTTRAVPPISVQTPEKPTPNTVALQNPDAKIPPSCAISDAELSVAARLLLSAKLFSSYGCYRNLLDARPKGDSS